MYNIGIDLGGTNIKVGVVNDDFRIVGKSNIKTDLPRPAEEIADSIAKGVELACKEAGIDVKDINSIGIGTPGVADRNTGVVLYSCNLGFNNTDLGGLLKHRLGTDIYVENDANVAAYGEVLGGAAKGYKDVVVITLGTGVGGGIIIDGKIYSGSNYAGAELGHMVIVKDGKECACGRKGCWEAYASATGLINLTKQEILKENFDFSYMLKSCDGDINKVTGKTAFDAVLAGDANAKTVIDEYIGYLACGLVNIINIFQPDILCIGGGISNQGENLLAPLRTIVEKERYTKHNDKQTVICKASLGNDAGIIGAAFLE